MTEIIDRQRRALLAGAAALAAAGWPRRADAAFSSAYPTRRRWATTLGPLRVPFVLQGVPETDLPKVQDTLATLLTMMIEVDAGTVLRRSDERAAAVFAAAQQALRAAVAAAGSQKPVLVARATIPRGFEPSRLSVACTVATYACVLRWHAAMAAGFVAPAVDLVQPPGPALAVESLGLGFGEALLRKAGLGNPDAQPLLHDRTMTAWQTGVVAQETEDAFAPLRGTAVEASAANLCLALGYADLAYGRPLPPIPPVDRGLIEVANAYAERVLLVSALGPLWKAVQ